MSDILNLIGEATEYDKKQEVERRKVKSWLKSVSAFANGAGGCLLFGVADDGTVVGLADAKGDSEFLSQKIKERIDPVPQTLMKIERVDGKDIIVLQVLHGEDTPYYYIGDGVLETFVRIGNESVVAEATEHKRLVLRGRNTSFDVRPTDESFDDYAFTKLRERYHSWNGVSFGSKLYRSFGLVGSDGHLTNAGLLLADECPLRQSRVFCTRWNGTTKSGGTIDALDSMEISGSLVKLLEDAMQFVRRNMRVMWYKEATQRIEIPEYVERSVMEVLVNALAHRDYLIQGSEVHVDMFNDRMVVYSPGAMPEGRIIQEMNFADIPSVRRNPVIADIFSQLGYMERKGSGMGKIMDAYKALPYLTAEMLPVFFSDRAQFTVTFPNMTKVWEKAHVGAVATPVDYPNTTPNYPKLPQTTQEKSQRLSVAQKRMVDFLKLHPTTNREELLQEVEISENGVKYNLKRLQEMGLIKHHGPSRGGSWEVL